MEKKRSVGVIIGSAICAVVFIAFILKDWRSIDIALWYMGGFGGFLTGFTGIHLIYLSLYLIFCLFLVIIPVGLVRIKNWARIGAIIGALGIFVYELYLTVYNIKFNIQDRIPIFFLLSSLFIIFFFTRPKVKRQFSKE